MQKLGYFYGRTKDSVVDALDNYGINGLLSSLDDVKKEFKMDVKNRNMGSSTKPKYYSVVVIEEKPQVETEFQVIKYVGNHYSIKLDDLQYSSYKLDKSELEAIYHKIGKALGMK